MTDSTREFIVSSADELRDVLGRLSGGETVLLETGNYGSFEFDNMHFGDHVTIRSADGMRGAKFADISITNSSYLTIDNVHVDSATNGARAVPLVNVDDGSHHIDFSNSEINGLVDSNYNGWRGIYVGDASVVHFENNYIHDVFRGGLFFGVDNLEVVGNRFEHLGDDAMKLSGVRDVLIENNTGARYIHPTPDAHLDFIQFQGDSSENITIRGNVYLAGDVSAQGIFLDDTSYDNILVEDNIIYNSMLNAIAITEGSTNVLVRNNTVLTIPNDGHKSAMLRIPADAVSENNISASYLSASGPDGSNVILQYEDSSRPYYYNDVYQNAMVGSFATIEDLTPVPGSIGETMGASRRIMELLDPTTTDTNDASLDTGTNNNDVENPPVEDSNPVDEQNSSSDSPIISDEIASTLVLAEGMHSFSGSIGDAIVLAGGNVHNLGEGTIEIEFNTGTVDAIRQGLFTKDSSGYDEGGHLGIFIEDDDVFVRMQDTSSNHELRASDVVVAGRDHHLVLAFGPDGLMLFLDGMLVDSNAYTGGLQGNEEPIVLGANQWASGDGVADNLQDPYSGIISSLNIYSQAADAATVAGDYDAP